MYVKNLKEYESRNDGWQEAWPTDPNTLWWFYGWRFGRKEDKEPELLLVEVWKIANGLTYVASGNFFEKKEGAEGMFRRVIPVIPIAYEPEAK
jgi:hypothetical protein